MSLPLMLLYTLIWLTHVVHVWLLLARLVHVSCLCNVARVRGGGGGGGGGD